MPELEFETALAAAQMPSARGIIAAAETGPVDPMDAIRAEGKVLADKVRDRLSHFPGIFRERIAEQAEMARLFKEADPDTQQQIAKYLAGRCMRMRAARWKRMGENPEPFVHMLFSDFYKRVMGVDWQPPWSSP